MRGGFYVVFCLQRGYVVTRFFTVSILVEFFKHTFLFLQFLLNLERDLCTCAHLRIQFRPIPPIPFFLLRITQHWREMASHQQLSTIVDRTT